jgi:hypothetical protein
VLDTLIIPLDSPLKRGLVRAADIDPTRLTNAHTRIDFEEGITGWTLQLCGQDPCPEDNSSWIDVPNTLEFWRTGYTGERSVALPLPLRTDRGQLYSAQFCLNDKKHTDVVLARLYAPETPPFTAYLLGQPSVGAVTEKWPSSTVTINKRGWYVLALDLRQVRSSGGQPFSEIGISCIHVDLALPRRTEQPEKQIFLIDDVESVTTQP